MTNEERMNILRLVFSTIFQSKAMNSDITQTLLTTNTGQWPGRWFVNNTLRGFDFTLNIGDRVISLRCLEQNPNKTDNYGNLKKYANLARQGHQIMWVIDRNTNNFLGRMHNNEWHASFDPATQPANYQQPTQQQVYKMATAPDPYHEYLNNGPDTPVSIEDLPEIPGGVGIPDYVLQEIGETDEEPPDWGDYE
jgi:hypothetical protein